MHRPNANYCYEHNLFFKDFCPNCRLEEWDFYTNFLGTDPDDQNHTALVKDPTV